MSKLNIKQIAIVVTIVLASVFATSSHAEDFDSTELQHMQQFINLMDGFFDIINSVHDISSDAEKSAIFQMHKIKEAYEESNQKEKIVPTFEEILQSTKSPAVRNAAYFMLGDALKESGRYDRAIELLKQGLKENIKQTN